MKPKITTAKANARELAQRLSGTVEVRLIWDPQIDQLELSVCNLVTGEGFNLEVAPGNAMDAFDHPYAYAARHENARPLERDETAILDG